MQQFDASSNSSTSSKRHECTASSCLSIGQNPNDVFLSLDSLPDPPCISIEELRQLNQAFNKLESSLPVETQLQDSASLKTARSNSFESLTSCSSDTTLDINTPKRPISKCSTVDVTPKRKL